MYLISSEHLIHRAVLRTKSLAKELKSLFRFLRPFSSEKGLRPPEALAAKPRDWSEATNTRKKALKGSGGKQEFSPSVCVGFIQHKRASWSRRNSPLTAVEQSNGTHW